MLDTLGFDYEYIPCNELQRYSNHIIKSIDDGIPVLVSTNLTEFFSNPYVKENPYDVLSYALAVGYLCGEETMLHLHTAAQEGSDLAISGAKETDLILFHGIKSEISIGSYYMQTLQNATKWLAYPATDDKYIGISAIRSWSEDVRLGRFSDENIHSDWWGNWGVYVCNLATSGGGTIQGLLQNISQCGVSSKLYEETIQKKQRTGAC